MNPEGYLFLRHYADSVLQKYDWDTLHPFQRRSFRRFPSETEFIPEISKFESLESLDVGIKNGKITLTNGTVLTDIDEVCLVECYLPFKT